MGGYDSDKHLGRKTGKTTKTKKQHFRGPFTCEEESVASVYRTSQSHEQTRLELESLIVTETINASRKGYLWHCSGRLRRLSETSRLNCGARCHVAGPKVTCGSLSILMSL